MKTKSNFIICFLISAFMLVSCEQESLNPLSGIYPSPELFDFTVLNSQNREKDVSLYIFSINLSDDASNTLNLKLVAADDVLPASDFTPSETATKKTYITGGNGSTCNGVQISSGTITVAAQDSNYTMNGILYLVDETVVKMTAAFTIAYEPDLSGNSYTYSEETETPALGGAQGSTEITGTTKHKISVFKGGELAAYFEVVINENATSLAGTYIVKDGLDAAGQVNNGYYLDLTWWGSTGILEGGSYYVESDKKMFIREGEGDITIADNAGTLTITGDNLGILDLATLIASSGATWTNLATTGTINFDNVTKAN